MEILIKTRQEYDEFPSGLNARGVNIAKDLGFAFLGQFKLFIAQCGGSPVILNCPLRRQTKLASSPAM